MSSEQCAAELQTASWTASVPSKTTTSDRAARGGAHAHTGRRGGPRASIGLADSSAYPRRRPRDSRASASIGPLGGVVLSRALHGGSTRRVLLARRAPSRAPRRAREGERAAPPPGARRVRGFRRGEASRRCRPLGRRALARRLLAEPDGRRRRRGAVRGDVEERVPAETREQPDARRGRDGEPAPARGTGQRGGDGAGARAKRAAPRLRAVGGDDGGIPRRESDPSLGDLRAVGGDDGVRSPPAASPNVEAAALLADVRALTWAEATPDGRGTLEGPGDLQRGRFSEGSVGRFDSPRVRFDSPRVRLSAAGPSRETAPEKETATETEKTDRSAPAVEAPFQCDWGDGELDDAGFDLAAIAAEAELKARQSRARSGADAAGALRAGSEPDRAGPLPVEKGDGARPTETRTPGPSSDALERRTSLSKEPPNGFALGSSDDALPPSRSPSSATRGSRPRARRSRPGAS